MKTYPISDAKRQLSRLVNQAASGEPFIVTNRGVPLVKVVAAEPHYTPPKRLGFLKGQLSVPDDFDSMGAGQIRRMFGSNPR